MTAHLFINICFHWTAMTETSWRKNCNAEDHNTEKHCKAYSFPNLLDLTYQAIIQIFLTWD